MALLLIPFTLPIWFSTLCSRVCRNVTLMMDLLVLGLRQTSISSIALGEVWAITRRYIKVIIAGSSMLSLVGLGVSLTTKLLAIALILKVVFSSFYKAVFSSFYMRVVYYLTLASKLAGLVG